MAQFMIIPEEQLKPETPTDYPLWTMFWVVDYPLEPIGSAGLLDNYPIIFVSSPCDNHIEPIWSSAVDPIESAVPPSD